MASIFKPKNSTTPGAVPTTANLADGEMAVNTADRRIFVRVGAAIVDLFNRVFNPFNQGNGFISWTGEATVTSSTGAALLDSTGAALSPTKTYKVAACNIDSSAQRGAVALFVGDGSAFTIKIVYEQGTTSSNVQLYLNAGVPSVSVYGGTGPYRIPYRIEEVPNFGQGLSEFALVQKINDAPSDDTTYGRKNGAWVATGAGGGASDPPTFTAKDANYTFVAGDAGLGYAVTTITGRTYTIPASVFSAGDKIWVAAQDTGTITLARGSGLTLRLGGSTNNNNRLVGAYGMACIYFISPTVAVVYGSGVG